MLQFIAKENDRYSVAEQVQMAVEGGCRWIVMNMDGADDAEIREVASEIIPVCKEQSTLLTIRNHVELARQLGIHGVLLAGPEIDFAGAREFCGPEAIIGVTVYDVAEAVALKDADVDYLALPYDLDPEAAGRMLGDIRGAGVIIPLVATGDYSLPVIESLVAVGFSGVALDVTVTSKADPVEATREIINTLSKYRTNPF